MFILTQLTVTEIISYNLNYLTVALIILEVIDFFVFVFILTGILQNLLFDKFLNYLCSFW